MLIGIDANEANADNKVGIGNYAFQLLSHIYILEKRVRDKNKNSAVVWYIYLKDKPNKDFPPQSDWWQYKVFGPSILWTQLALPFKLLAKFVPDIFFSLSHYSPILFPKKKFISIMDVSYLKYPEMFKTLDRLQLKLLGGASINSAYKIFTISNFSKKEIMKYYGIPEKRIFVTYPGYDNKRFTPNPSANQNNIYNKYNISSKYLLFVGTIQPRKNITSLVKAFEYLKEKQPNLNQLSLVLVGKKGWLYKDIISTIRNSKVKSFIHLLDYVDSEDLPELYRQAELFTSLSLYEGFGIPFVEAMACGCPVLAAATGSLPEIVGPAGLYCNPYEYKDIADKIKHLINDQKLRQNLIEKGFSQIKLFSWKECARKTLTTLKESHISK